MHRMRAGPFVVVFRPQQAKNISYWLKVQPRRFKNYISANKCILISYWIFQHWYPGSGVVLGYIDS